MTSGLETEWVYSGRSRWISQEVNKYKYGRKYKEGRK